MKGIVNTQKIDINGEPGEIGLLKIPKEEQGKYWYGLYYEGKGLPFECNRCGERQEANDLDPFYLDAKNKKELKKFFNKEIGYYKGYCELDSGAKGYSFAYEYRKDLAYDYHKRHVDKGCFTKKINSDLKGVRCITCETWEQGFEYVKENYLKPNQERPNLVHEYKKLFNEWYEKFQ